MLIPGVVLHTTLFHTTLFQVPTNFRNLCSRLTTFVPEDDFRDRQLTLLVNPPDTPADQLTLSLERRAKHLRVTKGDAFCGSLPKHSSFESPPPKCLFDLPLSGE